MNKVGHRQGVHPWDRKLLVGENGNKFSGWEGFLQRKNQAVKYQVDIRGSREPLAVWGRRVR